MRKEWKQGDYSPIGNVRSHIAFLTSQAWDARKTYRKARAEGNGFGQPYYGARYTLLRSEINTLQEIVMEGVAA